MGILQILTDKLGCKKVPENLNWSLGGLNQTAVARTDKGVFFIKRHAGQSLDMYQAEYAGLKAIIETGTIRAPEPIDYGQTEKGAYLIMEHLELERHTPQSQRELGEGLARMHLSPAPDRFGFKQDNTIGTTPQKNPWTNQWVEFFLNNRLGFQLQLIDDLYKDGELRKKAEPLLKRFSSFFKGIGVTPSLIHGDLWGGNTASMPSGDPVIFDPAVYYGHYEAEFGIIEMFGGFSNEFYTAYESIIPREEGFRERVDAYRLYHTLNHYVLFGPAYRAACLSICADYS